MFRLDSTKLHYLRSIWAFDPRGVGAIVFVDKFSPNQAFPGPSENEIVIAIFHDKNWLFNIHTTDIHGNFMTDTNRTMFIQLGIGFGVVFVDPPTNIGIDREFQAFKDTPGHHIEFRSIVHKGIDIKFVIEGDFGTPGGTCVELFEVAGVDTAVEN